MCSLFFSIPIFLSLASAIPLQQTGGLPTHTIASFSASITGTAPSSPFPLSTGHHGPWGVNLTNASPTLRPSGASATVPTGLGTRVPAASAPAHPATATVQLEGDDDSAEQIPIPIDGVLTPTYDLYASNSFVSMFVESATGANVSTVFCQAFGDMAGTAPLGPVFGSGAAVKITPTGQGVQIGAFLCKSVAKRSSR